MEPLPVFSSSCSSKGKDSKSVTPIYFDVELLGSNVKHNNANSFCESREEEGARDENKK